MRRLSPTFFLSAQVQLEKVKTELTNARNKAMDGNENYLPPGDQVDAPQVTLFSCLLIVVQSDCMEC